MFVKFALAVVCVAACAGPARAQRFVQMTTADAASKARAIVVAQVLSVQVREEGNIYTFIDFQSLDVVKGQVPARFTYRILGGRIGNTEVSGGVELPRFTVGETVVLFLGPEVSADGYPTVFLQHIYRVSVPRGGVRTVSPTPTALTVSGVPTSSGALRLEDFLSALRRAQ